VVVGNQRRQDFYCKYHTRNGGIGVMLVVSYGSVYNYIRKYLMQILGWMDRDV